VRLRAIGPMEPSFAWDGARLYDEGDDPSPHLRGAAASVLKTDHGGWRLLRDPLGINKLFWVQDDEGDVVLSTRPWRLIEAGFALEHVRAFPRGRVAELLSGEVVDRPLDPDGLGAGDALDPDDAGARIRTTLDRYLNALATRHGAARTYVCLSGGLDSSAIAVLAREHFPDAVGVSFDLDRAAASDDRLTARRLAHDLGMPLLEATASAEGLLDWLDTVLRDGIDWRDFNVHAGLVNAALADAIATDADGRPALVLTGDLPNEFLVDYHAETYRGTTYYELPRLGMGPLRSALVAGLDSSHREIGVFGAWGLPVVQPYAVAVDSYLRLSEALLELDDRKERLCRVVLGDRLPDYVYSRPKARAQLGGGESGGGVLGMCLDRGVDAPELRRRFARLHGAEEAVLGRFLRAGRYRAGVPAAAGAPVA